MWFAFLMVLMDVVIISSILDLYFLKRKHKKFLLAPISFSLCLLAGLRSGIDRDYLAYVDIYNNVPSINQMLFNNGIEEVLKIREEIGYIFINVIFKSLTDNPEYMFCCIAGIALYFYYNSFKQYSEYPIISLCIYFSLLYIVKEVTQIRHGVAMALFLFSIRYILSEQLIKFLMVILLASSFHLAIIPSLLVYPMQKIQWNLRKGIYLAFFCCIVMQFNWINVLLSYLFQNDFGSRVLMYEGTHYMSENSLIRFYRYFFMFTIFLICGKYLSKKNKYYNIMLSMLALGLIYLAAFHEFIFMGDRMASSLWLSLCFLLPALLELNNNKIYKLTILIIIYIISLSSFSNNLMLLN